MLRSKVSLVVLMILLGLLGGCVPSAPPKPASDQEMPPLIPEEENTDQAPIETAPKIGSLPEPEGEGADGLVGFSMKPMEQPNAFAKVVRKENGGGYTVSGSFGLDASIQWDKAKKLWVFSGSLFFPNEDIKLFGINSHGLGTVENPASDAKPNEQAGIWVIDLAINAAPQEEAAAADKLEHPFRYELQAPSNAYFTVTFIQEMS